MLCRSVRGRKGKCVVSRIADDQKSVAVSLETLYAPIAPAMEQVEQLLRREMRSRYPFVDELVRYGCLLGGKRLRPALLLLTGLATGNLNEHHLTLAAVVEMIHTATLVHDDVLDEACMRRHLATVNARWDDEASLLLGDFLFSHAFYLASTTESTVACQVIGRSTNIVCEGEIRQKGSRSDFELTENEYYEIVEAKTAELCACCCRLGAHFAGASPATVERMTNYGRCLGIAFQIADDLLDLTGDEAAAGKSLGTDLAQRKPTLPLIRALQLAHPAQRQELLSGLRAESSGAESSGVVQMLRACWQQYDVLSYTLAKAHEFAQHALEQLAGLPPTPAKDSLTRLGEFVVHRSH